MCHKDLPSTIPEGRPTMMNFIVFNAGAVFDKWLQFIQEHIVTYFRVNTFGCHPQDSLGLPNKRYWLTVYGNMVFNKHIRCIFRPEKNVYAFIRVRYL